MSFKIIKSLIFSSEHAAVYLGANEYGIFSENTLEGKKSSSRREMWLEG
jgi:hypothetical protein